MDDEDGGLLNIEISEDEADTKKKADRTGQTEEEFQAVRREYQAKIENGDIHKSIKLPLKPGANKLHLQEVIHSVEELYFFRQYQAGIDMVQRALSEDSVDAFDDDSRKLLRLYEEKCKKKLSST